MAEVLAMETMSDIIRSIRTANGIIAIPDDAKR
jgi:hypothetical protein